MAKYKPKDKDIFVTSETVYGTRDNDIFHITSVTANNVEIYPKNQANDMLSFDNMALSSITASHIVGTKDIKIIYSYNSQEKSLIIKNYFSSNKATTVNSSLKKIHYTKSNIEYDIVIASELLFNNMTKLDPRTNKVTGSDFADYVDLSSSSDAFTVNAGNGNDYIVSGQGNDSLTGGKGTNTYAYKSGAFVYGDDIINLTKGEIAKINYEANSSKTAFGLDGKGNAIIHLNTDLPNYNHLTLKDFAKKDIVKEIEFIATNETKNLKDISWYYAPTDDYSGSYLNEHIDAKGINTAKKDKKGNTIAYTFKTQKGDDIIEPTKFADKITAGIGTNEIRYSTPYPGFDGLDQLAGDTIYLTKNENLTIDLTGISYYAVATYALSKNDLVVTVNVDNGYESPRQESFTIADFGRKDVVGAKGKVVLVDQNNVENDLKKDIFVVADTTKGTFHNDIINQSDYKIYKTVKVGKTTTKEVETNTTKKGLSITGAAGNDIVTGSNYSDTIKGGAGNDTISGGTGNDKLYGEAGENTIKFKAGDGIDTVFGGTGEDTLEFSGISIRDLQFSKGKTKKDKNDLIIKYSENDSVTVKNYFAVNKKTKLPTTSIKYIKTNEGTLLRDNR